MKKSMFSKIDKYMHTCMTDSAHDVQHVYRVLYSAIDIASEDELDREVLIAAALLHDIGREAQSKDKNLDHAAVGAEMAYDFLVLNGWSTDRAMHVYNCILTHRFRNGKIPATIEAEILFDADKLDVTGTIGAARTLLFNGCMALPLYTVDEQGNVLDGSGDEPESFFREYYFKLRKVHDIMYTEKGRLLAEKRIEGGKQFYENMYHTVKENHQKGTALLGNVLAED